METTRTVILLMIPILGLIFSIILVYKECEKQKNIIHNDIDRVIAYRNKHPRCRYCKYLEITKERIPDVDSYGFWDGRYITIKHYRCKLKDKDIKLNNSFKGCFCCYFKLGDIKND